MTQNATATALAADFAEDPAPSYQTDLVTDNDALLLNIDGFEGPIDVLLELARQQKVDLSKISILQLARQYLAFIERAKALDLELAADYLVMAAWLAYLKSRLLLPRVPTDDGTPDPEDIAAALQFQLQRRAAMQKAAQALLDRPRLGRAVFARGNPEGLAVQVTAQWQISLFDLLQAYGAIERRKQGGRYDLPVFTLVSMDEALARMQRMLGTLPKIWTTLEQFFPDSLKDKAGSRLYARSALASTLSAGLELVRQGALEIRQDKTFGPIYVRGTR